MAKCVSSALRQPSLSRCSAPHPSSSPSTAPGCRLPTSALMRGRAQPFAPAFLQVALAGPIPCPRAKALALTQLTLTWDLLPVNAKRRVWEALETRCHCPTIHRGLLNVITRCCGRIEDVEAAYKKANSWKNVTSDACTEPFPPKRATSPC